MNWRKRGKKAVIPELTPEQKAFQDELNQLESVYKKAKEAYWGRFNECKHVTAHSGVEDGSAWCAICGNDLGHYCPESPDHACHYFTNNDGKIELSDGTIVDVPNEEHDPDYETDDDCLFCHAPQERK